MSGVTLAMAQHSSHTQQINHPNGGTIDMSTKGNSTQRFTLPSGGTVDFTPLSLEAARQSEINRQLQEAGINLTPEQKTQLQQAISGAIATTLTPEQRQLWQRYLSDRAAQANRGEVPMQRDRATEEAIKQALTDAGVPLTPEQEARMEQINEQMGKELEQTFRTNSLPVFGQLLTSFFLPQPLAERVFGASTVGNAVRTYIEATNTILTPEQQQIWNRYWSDRQGKDA